MGEKQKANVKLLLFFLLALFVFYKPYDTVIEKTIDKSDPNPQHQYAYAFRHIEKEYPGMKQFYIYEPSASNYPLVFYQKVFNSTKNYNISFINSDQLNVESLQILILEHQLEKLNKTQVTFDIIFKEDKCWLIKTKRSPVRISLVE